MTTYYEILGVEKTATSQEITKAFRKLALQWHPDKNPDNVEEATRRFKEIGAAYETLRDEEQRCRYDAELRSQEQTSQRQGERHSNQEAEEKEPDWHHREMSQEDVEKLLRMTLAILREIEIERQRQKALGEQLVKSIQERRYDALPDLIAQGAYLDELSNDGLSGVHYAVRREDGRLLAYLLKCGADVNRKSRNGGTPLHYAVWHNNLNFCKKLVLHFDAQTHHQDNQNKDTPLHYAIEHQYQQEIQNLLISHASSYGWFFSRHSALDCQDLLQETPLHLAIKTKQFNTVVRLIKKGVKTDLKDQNGDTALDLMTRAREDEELPSNISDWLERKLLAIERQQNEPSSCTMM